MSVWRRRPLSENPYTRNAFRVARLPREVVRHRTVVQIIGQTMQAVETDCTAHVILGVAVTPEDVNWAEQILLDPGQRLEEELVEHAREPGPAEALRKLDRRAVAHLAELQRFEGAAPLECLRLCAKGLLRRFLSTQPPAEPSFGALELELVTPFGDD